MTTKEQVCQALKETVAPVFMDMLKESEGRIADTHEMVQKLADTCKANMEMYDKHLSSLEASRDRSQQSAAELVKTHRELTEIVKAQRDDYTAAIADLKRRLERKEKEYEELMKSFIRLTDKISLVGSSSSVTMSSNNKV